MLSLFSILVARGHRVFCWRHTRWKRQRHCQQGLQSWRKEVNLPVKDLFWRSKMTTAKFSILTWLSERFSNKKTLMRQTWNASLREIKTRSRLRSSIKSLGKKKTLSKCLWIEVTPTWPSKLAIMESYVLKNLCLQVQLWLQKICTTGIKNTSSCFSWSTFSWLIPESSQFKCFHPIQTTC